MVSPPPPEKKNGLGKCLGVAITKDRRICHFLSDHSTKSADFNSIFLDEIYIFSKKAVSRGPVPDPEPLRPAARGPVPEL